MYHYVSKSKLQKVLRLESQNKFEQERASQKYSEKDEERIQTDYGLGNGCHPAAIWVLFSLLRKSVFILERKGQHEYEKEIIQDQSTQLPTESKFIVSQELHPRPLQDLTIELLTVIVRHYKLMIEPLKEGRLFLNELSLTFERNISLRHLQIS